MGDDFVVTEFIANWHRGKPSPDTITQQGGGLAEASGIPISGRG
jgi:hypothetical protein